MLDRLGVWDNKGFKPFLFVKSAAHSELNLSSPDISTLSHSWRTAWYIISTFTAIFGSANGMRSVFVLFSVEENGDNIFLFWVINASNNIIACGELSVLVRFPNLQCDRHQDIILTLLQGQSILLQRQLVMRLVPLFLTTLLQPVKQLLQLPIQVCRCVIWHHQAFCLLTVLRIVTCT